jgi:hypothetical protein
MRLALILHLTAISRCIAPAVLQRHNITRAGAQGSQGNAHIPHPHMAPIFCKTNFQCACPACRGVASCEGGPCRAVASCEDGRLLGLYFIAFNNALSLLVVCVRATRSCSAQRNGSLKIRPPEFTLAAWVRDMRLIRFNPVKPPRLSPETFARCWRANF